jgi:hypothetical protein
MKGFYIRIRTITWNWMIILVANLAMFPLNAQRITLDEKKTYQTIHSFGASDCWSAAMVGRFYQESKKKQIAEWLFSQETDAKGNPKGIGLSQWRFNIGAGSAEQGKDSRISNEWRRAESFYGPEGQLDWEKQEGQRYFLQAAHQHKVPFTVGFLNSSPVQMTLNGLAFGHGKLGEWNFKREKIDDWVNFLVNVSAQFSLSYVSPFNEPQWEWAAGKSGDASQEGTPINNSDIAWAVKRLDEGIRTKGLKTRILIPEAGQLDYLYRKNTNRTATQQDNQIEQFFKTESPDYLGNLASMEKVVAGHSYFTTSPNTQLIQKRKELQAEAAKFGVDFWQSEYCILGDNAGEIKGNGADLGMKTALYVAKVIHADLVYAQASSWSWWLSLSANDYKDGLIYLFNGGLKGENDANKYDSDILDSKTLWAFGNYARFVRPGMKRFEVQLDHANTQVSGYKSDQQTVLVIVNAGESFELEIPGLRKGETVARYVTSSIENLGYDQIKNSRIKISGEAVVTLVFSSKREIRSMIKN